MKLYLSLALSCALMALACSPQAESPTEEPEAQSEAVAKEEAEDPGPALKSLHLLNMPAGVSETEIAAALAEINGVIAGMGYPGSGYRLWERSGEGEGEGEGEYSHVWEGSWPSQAGYDTIHEAEAYKNALEPHMPLFQKLMESQVYQRYEEVTTN